MPSYTYDDILQTFENSKCELLTTENEFLELLQVDYIDIMNSIIFNKMMES